jgi:hypothetical protein
MQITCFNDKNTWTVGPIDIAAAKLRYALGFAETAFICPKCGKANNVTKADFQVALNAPAAAPKPAGPAAPMPSGPGAVAPSHAPGQGLIGGSQAAMDSGAGPAIATPHHGTVITRSLHVRKDHSTTSETMAGLVNGDKVTIQATWTDGKNTWAQLGPDRWSAIIYNGEALIKLDD